MRKVSIYEYKKVEGENRYEKVYVGIGIFHQFGVDYEEFETGPGNYSTAIVELENGTVENIPVGLIRFET